MFTAQHVQMSLPASTSTLYFVSFPISVDCGECVDRLVSIVTSIEALLQGLVSSVNTLVALHQLDVVGLQNLSMRVDEIMVRLPPSLVVGATAVMLHIYML